MSANYKSQGQAVTKRRILVVDYHPVVRQGLALLINREPDLVVCGEAEDAMGAMHVLGSARPDVLVVDISLNGPDGLDLLKNIRNTHPTVPVLILSMHDESIYAERALRAGANGYIMKQEATEKVLVAVRRILSGEIYVSDRIANRMLKHYITGSGTLRNSSIADLSDRELEVFRLIGEGHGTRVSVKTVESYQAHIKEKLSLRSARELMQHAIQWNMNEKSNVSANLKRGFLCWPPLCHPTESASPDWNFQLPQADFWIGMISG
jgi:DNA-binding NarL/FixJ family response regulator